MSERLPQIFADTSNISEIERLKALGIIDGITTNPLIVAKEAGTAEPISYYRQLVNRFPNLPISIQLIDGKVDDLFQEAKMYAEMSPQVVIKVPMFPDGRGLSLVSKLAENNIPTNVTALMTKEHVLLTLLAARGKGPNYVSLFFNRIIDGKGQPEEEIIKSRQLIDSLQSSTQIIVGSIRKGEDIYKAMVAGAHIVTVNPKIIWEMVKHPQSEKFINEAQARWNEYVSSRLISQVALSTPGNNNH